MIEYTYHVTVCIGLSTDNGTFSNQGVYPVGLHPYGVAAVDLNDNKRPDIIVANFDSDIVTVLFNC